jgi:predicted GH43/DUF377 family glycosyl hydrolase
MMIPCKSILSKRFHIKSLVAVCAVVLVVSCTQKKTDSDGATSQTVDSTDWALFPFVKVDSVNPILTSNASTVFKCPVWKHDVHWEAHDVYNPSAIVRNDKIYLVYRAEDTVKAVTGTSRLGLAESTDGIHFTRLPQPVFYPDEDFMKKYEWMGGCEDPRIVEDSTGTYVMTYTAYDGNIARLCIASSKDLLHWQKHGLVFGDDKYKDSWSKSGAIVCEKKNGKLIAVKINGKYWMYYGEGIMLATSDDLIHWKMLEDEKGQPLTVIHKRADTSLFDNGLVEAGPPPILTKHGILVIYNGARKKTSGEGIEMYSGGQALMDKNDPSKMLSQLNVPFIYPEKDYELAGLVNKVTFSEGLVFFKGKWFLYYGTADSKIAVAVCENDIENEL